MAISWKNEWSNNSFVKASSQWSAKSNKVYDSQAEWKKYDNAYTNYGGTVTRWVSNWLSGYAKDKKQRAEYRSNLTKITNAKQDLTDNYNKNIDELNLNMQQSLENMNIANTRLQQATNSTIENRDISVKNSGNALATQSEMNATELQEMRIQNQQTVNAEMQNLATSGFKATASALNRVNEATRKGNVAYAQKQASTQLSQMGSLQDMRNAYIKGTNTAQGYQQSIEDNTRNWSQTVDKANLSTKWADVNYSKEMDRYTGDLNNLQQSNKLANTWETAGGWADLIGLVGKGGLMVAQGLTGNWVGFAQTTASLVSGLATGS